MKFKAVVTVLEPVIEIEINPEELVFDYIQADSADDITEDMIRYAAYDDYMQHHLHEAIQVKLEKVEE